MTKTKQYKKNIDLSGKLAEYIISHPKIVKDMPKDASFVVFASKDKELNKENQKLVLSLKSEGKKVVKAIQKQSKKDPWSFSLAI